MASEKLSSDPATNSPREGREYHHGDLRQALVAAASQLLEETGTATLSLRSVARTAGVSHAAPYRHFKDKHELLEAVAAAGFDRLETRLDEVVIAHADDHRRQIVEASRIYVEETLSSPHRAHLMFGGFLDSERRSPELETAIEASFGKLVATIRRGEGTLYRPLPTRDLVLTLWSATHGFAMLAAAGQLQAFDPGSDPLQRMAEVIEHILTGLALAPSCDAASSST